MRNEVQIHTHYQLFVREIIVYCIAFLDAVLLKHTMFLFIQHGKGCLVTCIQLLVTAAKATGVSSLRFYERY